MTFTDSCIVAWLWEGRNEDEKTEGEKGKKKKEKKMKKKNRKKERKKYGDYVRWKLRESSRERNQWMAR